MLSSRHDGVRCFVADRRGTTALLMGWMLGLMALCGGAAVDVGRWLQAKSVNAAALDAAVLAGGRKLQLDPSDPDAAIEAAKKFYEQNVNNRIEFESNSVSFAIAADKMSVTASGSAYIRTTILNVAGIERMPVFGAPGSVAPKAELSVGGGSGGSNLEVSLVLDMTSSMCASGQNWCDSSAKLNGLKAAAKDLIDIVVSDNQSTHYSKVAIVPFSTRVRLERDTGDGSLMAAVTNLPATWNGWYKEYYGCSGSGGGEGSGTWTCAGFTVKQASNWKILPCVTDRFYRDSWTYDYTDDAPGPGLWLNAHDGSRRTLSEDSSDTLPTSGRGLTSADPADYWNYNQGSAYCGDVSDDNVVQPLTSSKPLLRSRIDALSAEGATAGALGTAFGWYMLSPRWSGIWTGQSTPAPYTDLTTLNSSGAPKLRKVAVIMSDGVYNSFIGWKEQDQQEMSNHAKQLCGRMKAEGIEIYTVGFALNELAAGERAIAEDTLRACGSSVQHFYETLTVEHLRQAFRDIAISMTGLYLSK